MYVILLLIFLLTLLLHYGRLKMVPLQSTHDQMFRFQHLISFATLIYELPYLLIISPILQMITNILSFTPRALIWSIIPLIFGTIYYHLNQMPAFFPRTYSFFWSNPATKVSVWHFQFTTHACSGAHAGPGAYVIWMN